VKSAWGGCPQNVIPALSLLKGEWLWTITSTASTNVIPALSGNPGALAIVAIVGWVK